MRHDPDPREGVNIANFEEIVGTVQGRLERLVMRYGPDDEPSPLISTGPDAGRFVRALVRCKYLIDS